MGLRFVFDLFGPSARICYATAGNYTLISQHLSDIKAYLCKMQRYPLRHMLNDLRSAPHGNDPYLVFCIWPGPQSLLAYCDITSKYLGRLMVDCWAEDEARLSEMRAVVSRIPAFGFGLESLFEQFTHTVLSREFCGTISVLPMIVWKQCLGCDTNIRRAAHDIHLKPRTSIIFNMKHFPTPTESNYYIPAHGNWVTWNSFIVHNGRLTLFQTAVDSKYNVLAMGLDEMTKVFPQPSYDLIIVVRKGKHTSGMVPHGWEGRLRLFVMELEDELKDSGGPYTLTM